MNTKVFDIVTERIVALLNQGVCPWRRPWNKLPIAPQNYATGHKYSGINLLLLSVIGYELPYFLTFKQATEHGGSVKKGSRGVPVVYWSLFETEETDDEGKPKKVPFLRYYTVFNASQIEGIEFPAIPSRTGESFRPIETAEAVVTGWADCPRIVHGFNRAEYVPALDVIRMPSPTSFDSPSDYYATLFHEMGHATGAKHRLDRKLSGRFGDDAYSREELVAEMTAAFLCAHCGIDNSTIGNHAAYLAGWLKALKADPKLVVLAAGQAQKVANIVRGSATPENVSNTCV